VAYVTPIGSNPAQIEYRLSGSHGCTASAGDEQVDYHLHGQERPLVWVGAGLGEVGIEAGTVLEPEAYDQARALMNGLDPRTGERLVEAKLGIPTDAKVTVGPLVRGVRAACAEAAITPAELLGSERLTSIFERAERALKGKGEGALLRADEAGQLADGAGLNVEDLWSEATYAKAAANLTEVRTVTLADGSTAEEVVPRRVVTGNLGYDVSFTLPKSHSLLLAFAAEDDAKAIEATFATNVGRTFDWLERTTAYGMRGHHGGGRSARTVQGSGFLGWAMTHRAARPVGDRLVGDPHWHVHVSIANMTKGLDGKWSTVAAGGRDLMRHAPAVDHVLKALVRHELSTRFGVQFERNPRSKAWEVAAIPDETLREFSKRGTSIEAMLVELGLDAESATSAQARMAKDRTRQAKTESTGAADLELREQWQGEARAAGYDPDQLAADALRGGPAVTAAHDRARLLAGVVEAITDPESGLTGHRRRFTTADALAAVADAMPAGAATVEEIESLTEEALTAAGIVDLASTTTHGRDPRHQLGAGHMQNATRYTTADVVAAERVILEAAAAARPGDGAAHVDGRTAALAQSVIETSQGFDLSAEQSRIMTAIVTSDRSVEYLIGPPGTGKTTLMRGCRAAWEAGGLRVAGAATAAVAAQNLQGESGIESRTVASWILSIQDRNNTGGLLGVDVLVLDEANLTDDRDRAILYAEATRTGTKLVELGDPKQLRGVGCGSSFGYAAATIGAHELTENRRQRDEDERRILAAVRAGRYAQALGEWAGKGSVVITSDADSAAVAMTADWMRHRVGAPDAFAEMRGLLMLAATNEGVDRLNDAAHAIRGAQGELGRSHTYGLAMGGQLEVAEGDYVMIRRNDRQERRHTGDDILNGYRAEVTGIDERGNLSVQWDSETSDGHQLRTATLPPAFVGAGGVQLAYAMTTHKAEGLTVKEAWTRPDGTTQHGTVLVQAAGADLQSLYVALSRHAGEVRMFAGLDQVEDAQSAYERGPADSDSQRIARGVEAIAEHMRTTETNENDRPVHEDLVDVDAAAAATLARVRARTPQQTTPQEEATMPPTARTGEVLAEELRAGDVLLDHDGNDEVFVRRTRQDAAHQDVEIEYLVPGRDEPVRVTVPAAGVVLVADHLRVDQRTAAVREQEWIAQRRPPVDGPVVPDSRSALERIRDRVAARQPAQDAARKPDRTTAEEERAKRLRRDEDARRPQNNRGPSIR
jgi:conjugative relaxase-like TrwC/TraI family protein